MEEIIIAESMAVNITDWYIIIVVLGVGVALGMYISSQIKCHIRRNIFNNNLKRHDEEEKTKQQESKIHGQKPVKERGRNKKTRVYNS